MTHVSPLSLLPGEAPFPNPFSALCAPAAGPGRSPGSGARRPLPAVPARRRRRLPRPHSYADRGAGRPQIAGPQPCLCRLKAPPGGSAGDLGLPAAAQPRTCPANRLAAEPSTNQPRHPTVRRRPAPGCASSHWLEGGRDRRAGLRRRYLPLSGGFQSKGPAC